MEKIAELLGLSFVWLLVLSAIAYFCREALRTWIASKINHDNTVNLEKLKFDLSKKSEQFVSLRDFVFQNSSSRNDQFYSRQMLAVDNLWRATTELQRSENIPNALQSLNFEKVLKEAEKNIEFRETIMGWVGIGLDQMKEMGTIAEMERPYVSDILWAQFEAYRAIIHRAALQAHMIKQGVNAPEILETKNISKLIEAALPEYNDFVKEHGLDSLNYLVQPAREKVLKEIKQFLNQTVDDENQLARAQKIYSALEGLSDVKPSNT